MSDVGSMADGPIGVFDSGIGGLSVLREIARLLPGERVIYVADQAHLPYGPRPAAEIRAFAEGIARLLRAQGCKLAVVACNTASAAALEGLRDSFRDIPFVGMEPAVKPAAQRTKRGVVAVMATPGTLQGRLFAQTSERFAHGVRIVPCACPGLVELIERGEADTPAADRLLAQLLQPALREHADTLVLACTHYPFALEAIRRVVGPGVDVIDPAPAVARQVQRVLADRGLLAAASGPRHRFITSGSGSRLASALQALLHVDATVEAAHWASGELVLDARPAQAA